VSRFVAVLTSLVAVACGSADGTPDAGSELDGAGYPAPRTDLVPKIGTDNALDIGTWNIENFPRNTSTAALVADLIASMDLDIIAVQEIEDILAWDELVERLPDHDGVISPHTYTNGSFQKIGFLYKRDLVELTEPEMLFTNMGYEFPRPPFATKATVAGGPDLTLITVHLKAGRDFDDRDRRTLAIEALETHVADVITPVDPDVLLLGDFNETITSSVPRAVFDPFLDKPDSYHLHTDQLALEGRFSFVPSRSILDHLISSSSLADEFAGSIGQIPPLHVQLVNYENAVSDHLPVVVSMPIF